MDNITACVTIQTQNDVVYEDNELFMLTLITTHPRISIDVGSTTVEIIDDDGKYLLQFFGILKYCAHLIGVIVNWEQEQYSTSEGSLVTVCAVQPQPTERDFLVNINVPPNSGRGYLLLNLIM